ncbi:Kynurenine formamidase [Lachnellula occidentalis]|uniref:Kynurenine formamidase n=1 Tax=Lachnellula occidentalis TaxID=215460 RepID=A0A8H8S444_9HELO|nr:Kynurenine formamidase [Lachnellula occidentalis]
MAEADVQPPALIHSTQRYLEGPEATELHTVIIWTNDLSPATKGDGKIWVIYIHGGAWRDPAVDSMAFEPTVSNLWTSSKNSAIGAFASINYRLSPYPSHAQKPSNPNDSSRNVHHPAHLLDVANALLYLDEQYGIANRYILAGHSAGATMAFQLSNSYLKDALLPTPTCVLGVAGIYHFDDFVEAHKHIPAYKEIMENAFPDHNVWEDASPSLTKLSGPALWEEAKVIIISHSDADELVEEGQSSTMIKRARSIVQAERVHSIQTTGKHDEVWENEWNIKVGKSRVNHLLSSPSDDNRDAVTFSRMVLLTILILQS